MMRQIMSQTARVPFNNKTSGGTRHIVSSQAHPSARRPQQSAKVSRGFHNAMHYSFLVGAQKLGTEELVET